MTILNQRTRGVWLTGMTFIKDSIRKQYLAGETMKKLYHPIISKANIAAFLLMLAFFSLASAATVTYTYDSLNRVTSVDYGNGFTEDYTYDAAGNRLTLTVSSERISGTGYNYPSPGNAAGLSMAVRAASLATSWLNYYYSNQGINLESTLIAGFSTSGNTITLTGDGLVNGVGGYTFTVKIIEGSPDSMSIVIYNSDGTTYFNSGTSALYSGGFSNETDILTQHNLITGVSIYGAGSIIPDCSGVCWYDNNDLVTLNAYENSGYYFTDWTGCDLPSNNICTMTMDADKGLTANFQTCPSPIRIAGAVPVYYSTLQTAYDSAINGDTVQSKTLSLTENININLNKAVTLKGGYDCNYTSNAGKTTLTGNITISNGTVTVESFIMQ